MNVKLGSEKFTSGKRRSRYLLYFSVGSYAVVLALFIISIIGTFLDFPGQSFTVSVPPFFFIFLLEINTGLSVPLLAVLSIMFFLYAIFFATVIFSSARQKDLASLDSPMGFFIYVSAASLIISLLIFLIEGELGIKVGGSSLNTFASEHPLLGYSSLIYAPFVEELGFRILPLGVLSAILVFLKNRKVSHRIANRSILLSILMPGSARRNLGMGISKIEWIAITITSVLFGYAHIYFGGWDWGKLADASAFGALAAIGFLKFGAYMDILMHWFTNGLFGLTLYEGYSYTGAYLTVGIDAFLAWSLILGVIGLILMLKGARIYVGKGISDRGKNVDNERIK